MFSDYFLKKGQRLRSLVLQKTIERTAIKKEHALPREQVKRMVAQLEKELTK